MRQATVRALFLDFFFFNDTATTEIYTLSLHDALPICAGARGRDPGQRHPARAPMLPDVARDVDRKSTRLNSSHLVISYAVFCLKKKKSNLTVNSPPLVRPLFVVKVNQVCAINNCTTIV